MRVVRSSRGVAYTATVLVACWALAVGRTALRAQQSTPPAPPAGSQTPQARSVWDGVYTVDQAKRGADAYTRECARCHGPALEGNLEAPPLTGDQFRSAWDGSTLGALFSRISRMPDDDPGTLSAGENAEVLAYILSVNKFPAGAVELATQAEPLRQIRFEAVKKNGGTLPWRLRRTRASPPIANAVRAPRRHRPAAAGA